MDDPPLTPMILAHTILESRVMTIYLDAMTLTLCTKLLGTQGFDISNRQGHRDNSVSGACRTRFLGDAWDTTVKFTSDGRR